MSKIKIPEEVKNFFEDLNLRIQPDELYTRSDLYSLYTKSDVNVQYAKSTFGGYVSKAASEGILNLEFSIEDRAWVMPKTDESDAVDNITEFLENSEEEMEEPMSLDKGLMFDLIKNELSVAFRHVAENVSPELIKEMFKDQIAELIKKEFKEEVIPAVFKNLEKVIESTKEELEDQIDEKLDVVILKSLILEVIREAFEFPTSADMEDIKDPTEEI